jgi:hypothetical protein
MQHKLYNQMVWGRARNNFLCVGVCLGWRKQDYKVYIELDHSTTAIYAETLYFSWEKNFLINIIQGNYFGFKYVDWQARKKSIY